MPWIAVCHTLEPHVPERCPYCTDGVVSSSFVQPYAKVTMGTFPHMAESLTWKARLPACDGCKRWFQNMRTAYFACGILCPVSGFGGSGLLLALNADGSRYAIPLVVAALSVAAWAVLFALRTMALRRFRVVYVGTTEVAYATMDRHYGESFAAMNGVPLEWHTLFIRWD